VKALDELSEARGVVGAARVAKLRDAAEAIGDALRRTPIRSASHVVVDRVLVETRTVIPDARLVSPLVALVRRALVLVAADGTRILVDPTDAGPCTPYEERIASRHPVALRALAARGTDARWPEVDLVVSTSLALRSLPRAREALGKTRWIAHQHELEVAKEPPPLELPRYTRSFVALEPFAGSRVLAPGIVLIETPGPSAGHASIAFCLGGKVFVHTHAGVVVDAWSPYESTIPGLREAVRLRGVEAVIRGDATDPPRAIEAMTIERALADRRSDKPSLFRIVPGMELGPKLFMPRLWPSLSTLDP
jgi:glyoxylase-like metal-dependent hydrolase (beta-lactamase superfamily II)